MFILTSILAIIILCLIFFNGRNIFKIAYYETKLEIAGIDINRVKNMPIYKLWLD